MEPFVLHGCVEMPRIGLGTYRMPAADVPAAVDAALRAGYRLFDTAAVYRNEAAVGQALRDGMARYGLARSELFVTSKLAPADHGYEAATRALAASVAAVGLGPLDLYLVHWPGARRTAPGSPENARLRRASWAALEDARAQGRVRAIGVSNYTAGHLDAMLPHATTLPAVNQVEVHPLYVPADTLARCAALGIAVQAYASLAQGRLLAGGLLQPPPAVTAAQMCLAWALQRGYAVIPKATSAARLAEDYGAGSVRLDAAAMAQLDALAAHPQAGKVCWDPAAVA